jgi:2-methylcitrate dehydratase PrpD
MSSRRTASQILAAFAADFDFSRLGEDHVARCGRALADTIAVAIAAQNEPAVRRACDYVETLMPPLAGGQGRNSYGVASLWGRGQQSTVEGAALFNGIAAHALDFDDASSPMSGHPSVALFPCLIALAEARDIGGSRLAGAYVVGFETCCKLGRALDLTHYSRGWHMTATIGTIAAAAACSHLLKLDAERITHAIGLALAQTGGTRENFGTDAKSFQAGQVNAAAIRAALLAERGFTASPRALDGKAGFTSLYSCAEDITPALATLGSLPLEIDGSGIEVKKYPACYGIHRPLDGLFDLMAERSFGLEDVERIDIETSYGVLSPLVRHPPRNGTEGKFSMEYTIAAAIADRGIRLSSYSDEAVTRCSVTPYMSRIAAREVTATMTPRWASIAIVFKNGQIRKRRIDALRGSPRSPLSDEELLAKVSDCISWGRSAVRPADLLEATQRLGTTSIRDLITMVERPNLSVQEMQDARAI